MDIATLQKLHRESQSGQVVTVPASRKAKPVAVAEPVVEEAIVEETIGEPVAWVGAFLFEFEITKTPRISNRWDVLSIARLSSSTQARFQTAGCVHSLNNSATRR